MNREKSSRASTPAAKASTLVARQRQQEAERTRLNALREGLDTAEGKLRLFGGEAEQAEVRRAEAKLVAEHAAINAKKDGRDADRVRRKVYQSKVRQTEDAHTREQVARYNRSNQPTNNAMMMAFTRAGRKAR